MTATFTFDDMGIAALPTEQHYLTSVQLAPNIGIRSTLHFDREPVSSERGWATLDLDSPDCEGTYWLSLTVPQLRQLALLCNVWADRIDSLTTTTTTGESR